MEHHGTMDENNEDEMETGDALGFFLESDLLHFFHHYATKKFEQMAVLKRQMVDDLVSILLGFPKGRCHDDVATMSKATRMVSLQSLCTLRDGNGNGYDVLPFRCAKSFHAWGEKGIFHVRLVRCWGCLKVIVPKAYCFECLC